jgi:HEAT repeat protein
MKFGFQEEMMIMREARKRRRIGFAFFFILSLGLSTSAPAQANRGNSAPAGTQERLVAGLANPDKEQRMEALVELSALFRSAPGIITDSTIIALAETLQHDLSPVVRALAARTLELGGDANASKHLIAALVKEKEVAVRKAIAYALARYPSAPVTYALIELLKDKKQEVRAAAAYGLAESGDPLALKPLLDFLRKRDSDEDSFARSQAARGLGKIARREALDPLLKSLTHDDSGEVRREAAGALGNIATKHDLKVIDALREATLSSDPYLSSAAADALANIHSRSLL